jgi:molybdopterin molybdotransferase
MVEDSSVQRITRLTPLNAILALIESRVKAVKSERCELARALGSMLAEDVVAQQLPRSSIALRDGIAVEATAVADASSYAPVPLSSKSQRIEIGETMPEGSDAVLPLDAVVLHGDRAEAIGSATSGEGVLPAGGDFGPRTVLRRAGEKILAVDIAVMAVAGLGEVAVRSPRIRIVHGGAKHSPMIDAALGLLVHAVTEAGGAVGAGHFQLDAALDEEQADAILAIGGTGSGVRDMAVRTLARFGTVEAHGIAISPGETAAFGFVDGRPVLLVPGRLDAALAAWLLIGRHLLAKLAGGEVDDLPAMVPLKRKITSTIGLTELAPVACSGGVAEPLASGYLSLQSLARSSGWTVIPADSEGAGAGTLIAVNPWP